MSATTTTSTMPKARVRKRRRLFPRATTIVSYAILGLLTVLYLGPILLLVNTALHTEVQFSLDPLSIASELNVSNFADAWQLANFGHYLLNSILYTTLATGIYLLTAVFVSVAISRRYVRGSSVLFTLFVIALFLPPAMIPQFQLMLALRDFSNILGYGTPSGFIMLFLVNPIGIIILVNYIKTVPKELDEAASLDGCSYWRYVVQIIIPVIRPAIATVAILHAIGVWNDYVMSLLYLNSPDTYTITRGLIVFQGQYGATGWTVLASAVLMVALPMVIFFLFLQRYIIGGFTAGSVRG